MQDKIRRLIGAYGKACYEHGNIAAQYETETDILDAVGVALKALEALTAEVNELEHQALRLEQNS